MSEKGLSISRNRVIFLCIIVMLFLVYGLISCFFNIDWIILITFFISIGFIAITNKMYPIKYFLQVVLSVYHVVSVFIVENYPQMLYNLNRLSYHTGSFIYLTTFYLVLFFIIYILESNNNSFLLKDCMENTSSMITVRGKRLPHKVIVTFFSAILLIFTIYMISRVIHTGYYSMGGIDRFQYRATVFKQLDNKFYTYIMWFLPIPLMASNAGIKKIGYVYIGLFCFYLIWVGDKFGSLFTVLYFYLLVCWSTKTINERKYRRLLIVIGLLFAFLMVYIGYQVLYERGSIKEVLTYFNHRLTGGQSDLWWSTYDLEKGNGWKINELSDEFAAVISKPSNPLDYNFGIYKMMRVNAPLNIVNYYLSRGSRFTASTQASLFYYFKYSGLYLGALFAGILWFNLVNRAIRAYRRLDAIEAVCYTMLIQKANLLLSMSDITVIGHVTTILGVATLLFLNTSKAANRRIKYSNT